MSRETGKKGRHGETDRQIAFAILHNQMSNKTSLTKKMIAEIVETATAKDRDGVRKRVTYLLGPSSPIAGSIHSEDIEDKRYWKIAPRNLKDGCILFNFMKSSEEANLRRGVNNFTLMEDLVVKYIAPFIEEVVDYLYLWDPFGGPYGLPTESFEEFKKTGILDFYPERQREFGPEKMKRVLRDYRLDYSLSEQITVQYGDERFCRLIEGFEKFREGIAQSDSPGALLTFLDPPLRLNGRTVYSQKELIVGTESDTGSKLYGINPFEFREQGEQVIEDLGWFLRIWETAWRSGLSYEIAGDEEAVPGFGEEWNRNLKKYLEAPVQERRKTEDKIRRKLSVKYGVTEEEIGLEEFEGDKESSEFRVPVPKGLRDSREYKIYPFVHYSSERKYYEMRTPLSQKQKKGSMVAKEGEKTEKRLEKWEWKES